MRLSDLLHSEVVDADGVKIGTVDDVRLVQDGPVQGVFGAALRVDGVLIGKAGVGVRLGYNRGGVKGPGPLKALFSAMERRSGFVPWDQVASADENVLRLRVRADALGPVPAD